MRCALISIVAVAALRVPSQSSPPRARVGRRQSLGLAAGFTALSVLREPLAAAAQKVVVAGATGQTGRRVLERLAQRGGLAVVGGVRNPDKAEKDLASSSVTVRGAMVQNVAAVDLSSVTLAKLDVVKNSVDELAATLKGADALVIATGFVPGNPLSMGKEAHAVDNLGTMALVDAAKAAGVRKVVLVSSILTNGRAWGQENSPGFVVTNAFGGVLDEKIVAEKYLRASGLDYTIVRPGGLKATPPSGTLVVASEDTLNSGEVLHPIPPHTRPTCALSGWRTGARACCLLLGFR
jgi:NAD(P)-dependent dehydrogenase (short-subunit alcohol dehydrogenase family)